MSDHTQETDANGVWCREDGQRWPCDAVRAAEKGPRLNVKRLARAISDHGDICSRMAIPTCAEAIAREYAALARKAES